MEWGELGQEVKGMSWRRTGEDEQEEGEESKVWGRGGRLCDSPSFHTHPNWNALMSGVEGFSGKFKIVCRVLCVCALHA